MFNVQDPSSYIMMLLTTFHDQSMFLILFILSVVMYYMTNLCLSEITNRFLLYNEMVEFLWTLFPGILLFFIALPSLKILYLMESYSSPSMTIKVLGHQWFWSYEYSDFKNLEFSSYMLNELNEKNYRLLDVDNRMVLPINMLTRMLISSTDVIHSWTVPSMGVKMDANPGMLNQIMLTPNRMGLFYGQCSEICGSMHSFMPICLEVVNMENFYNWIKKK